MNDSLNVLVLFGGASAEHPISLRSAATVLRALGQGAHAITTVGITREGCWRLGDFSELLTRSETEIVELDPATGAAVTLGNDGAGARLLALDPAGSADVPRDPIDVVFPVLHGPGGEDGTVQGFLELLDLPFVGAGSAASAVAMDKVIMKAVTEAAGLPQVDYLFVDRDDNETVARRVRESFGYPCFVKPANLGSSVGVTRAVDDAGLAVSLDEARSHDPRVLVERGVDIREIEIALLGSGPPSFSVPGEIVSDEGFYDFEAKYVAATAGLEAPARIDADTLAAMEKIATEAWSLIGGKGMARVDFFVDKASGELYLNEFNTIPGFTEISMYPRLWRESGLDTPALVEKLLELAIAGR